MKYIKTLKRTTVPTYFNQYIGSMKENLDKFCNFLETEKNISKTDLDFSKESLTVIWKNIYPDIINGKTISFPDYKTPPIWTYIELKSIGDEARGYYSEETLWLLDGMMYYFAQTILNTIPNAYWGICDFNVTPKVPNQLKPVIFNVHLWNGYSPLDVVFTHFVGAHFEDMRDILSDNNFFKTLNYIVESTEKNRKNGLLFSQENRLYS